MRPILAAAAFLAIACGRTPSPSNSDSDRPRTHDALVALFSDWRAFQRPKDVNGAADYSVTAMAQQHRALPDLQARLASFDTTGWSVTAQVDYQILRAEMNGLDFDHRVLKPWTNNPAFYTTFFPDESDQPAREGPFAVGAVELWSYRRPLSAEDAAKIEAGVKAIPPLLAQAAANLTGNQQDLWTYGTRDIKGQSAALAAFSIELGNDHASLRAAVDAAKAATDDLASWLDRQATTKTGPSGVGQANYDWYLQHVMLLPYTWQNLKTLMERELWRSYAYLGLEELRNAGLPSQSLVASQAEHAKRFNDAVTEYVAFLKNRGVIDVKDYMDPRLRERLGSYRDGKREFFTEVDYRDPQAMRTHGFHWFDKGAMAAGYGNPIRNGPLLYNMFHSRTEGLATGWEEMMMGVGMFDPRPRSRELIYMLLAERAARAMGDLMMHANTWTLEKASEFASANTPRGWLSMDGNLVRGEQHLYLQQPVYGLSYVIGKIEIERTMHIRMRQLGEKFSLREFMGDLTARGQIPISLIRWEMTGELDDDLAMMLKSP